MPHATREERSNLNGVLVCWRLSNLPRPEWPPPILLPHLVVQLPRTEGGRVAAELVVPSIRGVLPDSHLATLYVTSSSELMVSVTDLYKRRDSVQVESSTSKVSNLEALDYGQSGYISFAIGTSWSHPSVIAIGTQYGVLFAKVACSKSFGVSDVEKNLFPDVAVDQSVGMLLPQCSSDCTSEKDRISKQQPEQQVPKRTP